MKNSLLACITLLLCACFAVKAANNITRDNFNFGHQLGYMYSRMDNAWFREAGTWTFETGFLTYYTPVMPLVQNSYWKARTIMMIPLHLTYSPCRTIELQADITDLFIEFPYRNLNNTGGKSPRFKTKVKLCDEKGALPAAAFTVGVKFSSAKPYTIWENRHNYDSSNGLAGAGTGVADYLLLFTFSRHLGTKAQLHGRIGLAPLGSPVEYTRGSAQADEIPYGLALRNRFGGTWETSLELSGMYNGLHMTRLAHYSVARLQVQHSAGPAQFIFNFERGLTEETDTWVGGLYIRRDIFKR